MLYRGWLRYVDFPTLLAKGCQSPPLGLKPLDTFTGLTPSPFRAPSCFRLLFAADAVPCLMVWVFAVGSFLLLFPHRAQSAPPSGGQDTTLATSASSRDGRVGQGATPGVETLGLTPAESLAATNLVRGRSPAARVALNATRAALRVVPAVGRVLVQVVSEAADPNGDATAVRDDSTFDNGPHQQGSRSRFSLRALPDDILVERVFNALLTPNATDHHRGESLATVRSLVQVSRCFWLNSVTYKKIMAELRAAGQLLLIQNTAGGSSDFAYTARTRALFSNEGATRPALWIREQLDVAFRSMVGTDPSKVHVSPSPPTRQTELAAMQTAQCAPTNDARRGYGGLNSLVSLAFEAAYVGMDTGLEAAYVGISSAGSRVARLGSGHPAHTGYHVGPWALVDLPPQVTNHRCSSPAWLLSCSPPLFSRFALN